MFQMIALQMLPEPPRSWRERAVFLRSPSIEICSAVLEPLRFTVHFVGGGVGEVESVDRSDVLDVLTGGLLKDQRLGVRAAVENGSPCFAEESVDAGGINGHFAATMRVVKESVWSLVDGA